MANRITLNVSLTPELEQFINARVASGRYQSASEVVREGLRLLEQREARHAAAVEELRELLAPALEEQRRGQMVDGEQFMADLLRRHEERVRAAPEQCGG